MREIKFRIGKTNSVVVPCKYDQSTNKAWITKFFAIDVDSSWHLMQFTGLKDKNGTEIYEGDIIQHLFRNQYTNMPILTAVIFEKGKFIGADEFKVVGDIMDKYKDSIEVIGNIYDHPGLLLETRGRATVGDE